MPVILGKEVSSKTLWIGGGLMAAAVAVIVLLRARSSAPAPAAATPATDDYGAGYGGSISVPAPSQGMADSYTQAMQNADIEAAKIANDYQKMLVTQQRKQFDFEAAQMEAMAPEYQRTAKAELAAEEAYYKAKAKIPIACPPGYARARDVNGDLVCNPKGSGNKIVKAVERGVADSAEQLIRSYGASIAPPSLPRKQTKQQVVTGGDVRVAPQTWGYGF